MTIQSRQWTEVEQGYWMLDMTYVVLYCVQTATGYRWERLYRVAGELVNDDCRSGKCKLRHHAATSAIRSVPSAEALRLLVKSESLQNRLRVGLTIDQYKSFWTFKGMGKALQEKLKKLLESILSE